MVEQNLSCKLCLDDRSKNLCIANCIGCKDVFCAEHLLQHRRDLTNEIDQLIERHQELKKTSFEQLNIEEQLQFVDRWEYETMEFIRQHTIDVKEKIRSMFNTFQSELKDNHMKLEDELQQKRDSNHFFERDLSNFSQRIEQFDKEIHQEKKSLHDITINELNQVIQKYKLLEKSLQWHFLHEIKLDSTYGYMAANNQHIFLGWKNRIVIYNLDGTKHDETWLQSTHIYGRLCDLIWSSSMQGFFILCRKSLFVHYPLNNQIEIIRNISLINQDNQYLSITSFQTHIALLNEQTLELWKYQNQTFILVYSIYNSLMLKDQVNENISSIRANEENLAVLIQNKQTHTWRIDLYNLFPYRRLQLGTSFDQFNQSNLGAFISLEKNLYLFMNWETKLMRMIGPNNSNEIIDYNAYNACLLGTQRKLVVNYMTHLKVYEF